MRRRAELVSRPAREKKRRLEGLGGCHLLAQADASCPAGQIVGHDLDGQPATVGGEAARGQVIEPHAVLQSLPRT